MRGIPFILALWLVCGAAQAALINPGFETGDLSGWSTWGDVLVDDGTFGPAPGEGRFQLLLTTLPNPAASTAPFGSQGPLSGVAAVSEAVITTALQLRPNQLDRASPSGNPVVQGSVAYQDVALQRGDEIHIDWNLLTNEPVPTQYYTDFAFFSLTPNSVSRSLTVLGDTNASAFAPSSSVFDQETGRWTTTLRAQRTSTYRIGVGVADVLDDDYTSALVVDRVRKNPEPETFALVAGGLVALAWTRRSSRGLRRP